MKKTITVFLNVLILSCMIPARAEESFPDVAEIVRRGEFRVLMTASPELEELPRRISPRDYDRALLMDIAEKLNVPLVYIYVEKFSDLIPSLLENKGDMIADNICVTEERKQLVVFTEPLSVIQDQIVTSIDNKSVNGKSDLEGKEIYYEAGTSYLKSLERLMGDVKGVVPKTAEEGVDTETILYKISSHEYPIGIADTNYVMSYLSFRDDIKAVYTFPEEEKTAWALRPDSKGLLQIANDEIKDHMSYYNKKILKGDLDQMRKRKFIRVLTRNNPSCYFIHRGQLMGFEYELVSEFAKRMKLNLIMIVPPKWSDLIPWLIEGKGDLIAASMTVTPERLKNAQISFCEPYCEVKDRIVGRASEKPFKSIREIRGRTVAVRKFSSYWETMSRIRKSGIKFKLVPVPEELETFEIIAKVAEGEYDLTVADEHIFMIESMRRDDIRDLFPINTPQRLSWAVRTEDENLKRAVDDFFKGEYKGLFFNTVYNKYFKSEKTARNAGTAVSGSKELIISPYDNLIRKYSEKYDMPWHLTAAQIYQESRFDPAAESWLGTVGLMQIMPATAKEMGFNEFKSPENNIHAGVKYMSKLSKRVGYENVDEERFCFALSSYNAGYGHVLDARRLAKERGYDPNRWFRNVEECMLLLEKPEFASKSKYGYCRGSEPVKYVREIIARYHAYRDTEKIHAPASP